MGKVSPDDARKARFLSEYRELCERHGMMVVMTGVPRAGEPQPFDPDADDEDLVSVFAVLDFSSEGDSSMELNQAITEMSLEELCYPELDEEEN